MVVTTVPSCGALRTPWTPLPILAGARVTTRQPLREVVHRDIVGHAAPASATPVRPTDAHHGEPQADDRGHKAQRALGGRRVRPLGDADSANLVGCGRSWACGGGAD